MAAAIITVQESFCGGICRIKWTWTSSDAGAASLVTVRGYYGQVMALLTDPGATAPTDNYDIVITDPDGYDVMQGAAANRDTANTEIAVPTATSVAFGPLTIAITNAGDTKDGVAVLYIKGLPSPLVA